MALDRQSIARRDFPTQRRGYDPAAVDAHLEQVAGEVETLQRRAATPPTASEQAAEQVKAIVQAAERGAEEIREAARVEAREHVARAAGAADRLHAKIEGLVADAERLRDELAAARAEAEGLGGAAPADAEPAAPAEPPRAASEPAAPVERASAAPEPAALAQPVAAAESLAPAEPSPVASEPSPAAAERGGRAESPASPKPARAASEPAAPAKPPTPAPAAPAASPNGDTTAARIVALDMALSGKPREETDRYLAEHYDVPDRGALLDEVYAAADT